MKYKDYLGYTAEAGFCFSVACSKCNKEIKCGSCSPKDIKFCQYCGHKLVHIPQQVTERKLIEILQVEADKDKSKSQEV